MMNKYRKEWALDTNIQKYRALIEAVDQGSFSRAAEVLEYSQPGVSRMIADLEHDWGVRLVERGRSGVTLTSEGEKIMPYVRRVVEEDRLLHARIDDVNGLDVGTIRIGTFSSVATHWLPQIIERFEKDYPHVDYELVMGDYAEIERWVMDGRVDCGFIAGKPRSKLDDMLLDRDEMLAVVPEGHPLAQLASCPLEALCAEPFMMLKQSGDTEVSGIFEHAGLKPQVRFVTWDDYAIMAMVEHGLGVSVLPSLILRRNPYHIVAKHLEMPAFRDIRVISRSGMSKVASKFMGYLRYRDDAAPAA